MDFREYIRELILEAIASGWERFASEDDCSVLTISEPQITERDIKTGKHVEGKIPWYSFSLRSGLTCPGASVCKATADLQTGKISRSPKNIEPGGFTCFAASTEMLYPKARVARQNNFDLLMSRYRKPKLELDDSEKPLSNPTDAMAHLIHRSLEEIKKPLPVFRIHVGGDFFSKSYINAWIQVATVMPNTIFYAYTKSLNLFSGMSQDTMPPNFRISASMGGKYDALINDMKIKFVKVVYSPEEAAEFTLPPYWARKLGRKKGLPIDHDDTYGWKHNEPYALLVHGMQAAGSPASAARQQLRKLGKIGSYGKRKLTAKDIQRMKGGITELRMYIRKAILNELKK